MALADPVVVYIAATNDEAHHLRILLMNVGVEAHVTENQAVGEVTILGAMPEMNRPQIWVDRSQIDRVRPLLADYENQHREQMKQEGETAPAEETAIEVVCEECGQANSFSPGLRGKVQLCRHCGAFVDVGGPDDLDYGDAAESETTSEE